MRFGKTRGLRAKAKLLARELVPERPSCVGSRHPHVVGVSALAVAYLFRPVCCFGTSSGCARLSPRPREASEPSPDPTPLYLRRPNGARFA